MSKQAPHTISEIVRQVFMAVSPARSAAYALAVTSSAGAKDEAGVDRLSRALSRVVSAEEMLAEGALARLAEAGLELAEEVEPLRLVALDGVRRLRAAAENAERGAFGPGYSATPTIADRVERDVTAFLDAFEAQAELDGAARTRRDGETIRTAVAEIRTIAASINLISINAAIEAARAGEAGHGFGVIATEIRNLSAQSQRSLDAIVASVERV